MTELTSSAREYGRRAAAKLFEGRKGHGGFEPITKRVLTRVELETIVAAAFHMGQRFEADRSIR